MDGFSNLLTLQPLPDRGGDVPLDSVYCQIHPRRLDAGDNRSDDSRPSDLRPGFRSDVKTSESRTSRVSQGRQGRSKMPNQIAAPARLRKFQPTGPILVINLGKELS
jgi:hypothetical protein